MHFNLTVDVAGEHLTQDQADAVLGALRGLSPVVGHTGRHPSVVVTVEAPDLRQAIASGLDSVEAVTGRRAVAVEALSTREFDERNGL